MERTHDNAESSQVVNKQRVADHGEVLTGRREVEAMLDLVAQEAVRIDSRFLEPACGNGNFLAAILERKLTIVEDRYARVQRDFERYAVLSISSLYGIDLLQDNVTQCRRRLFTLFDRQFYTRLYGANADERCRQTAEIVLEKNIVCGDALTLKSLGSSGGIVFPEWAFVSESMVKRRDFTFRSLLEHAGVLETPLFSDVGTDVFIPSPVQDYPPVHFLELAHGRDE